MSFNLDRNHMRSMINIYLFNCGLTDEDFTSITDQTLSRIMDRYHLTTTTQTHNIDVARAVQHTVVVLEAYFKIFDNVVHRMHLIDPVKTPWKEWKDVPPEFIYNYDEIGPNANQHHSPAVVSVSSLLEKEMIWQNSLLGDDKMNYHVSLGLTTQAAGNYHCPKSRQQGAPAPFLSLIHI